MRSSSANHQGRGEHFDQLKEMHHRGRPPLSPDRLRRPPEEHTAMKVGSSVATILVVPGSSVNPWGNVLGLHYGTDEVDCRLSTS